MRWTLSHELGHIILCHFSDYNLNFLSCEFVGQETIVKLDREADLFAEEFLMPKEFITKNYHLGFNYLKESFGVSSQALKIRLTNLGLVDMLEVAATRSD
jgi:Zn-dependent peptidase ImmA (M78 family)